jgi:formylglycine-generating enzyme required for sulfatase activity
VACPSAGLLAAALAGAAALCLVPGAPAAALEPAPPGGMPIVNSAGMELVLVPAGTFTMGSPPGAPLRQEEETTRRVTLTKALRIATTEVTQKQWVAVMGAGAQPTEDVPVTSVSWNDAQAFCRKLSQEEGFTYRLPTEAEWEYACRAGAAPAVAVERDVVAWHAGNSDGAAHAVALKQANAWGLFDTLGNAAEWTQDAYAPYPRVEETDPAVPATGGAKVVRGGSFRSFAPALRCAARTGVPASYQLAHVGFRVVRETR